MASSSTHRPSGTPHWPHALGSRPHREAAANIQEWLEGEHCGMEVSADQLKQAVEGQHGGRATLFQTVPMRETFHGDLVWEGVVHVFELEGHPKATRAYARSSPLEGTTTTPVLCRAAPGRHTVAAGRSAGGYRGGTSGQCALMSSDER